MHMNGLAWATFAMALAAASAGCGDDSGGGTDGGGAGGGGTGGGTTGAGETDGQRTCREYYEACPALKPDDLTVDECGGDAASVCIARCGLEASCDLDPTSACAVACADAATSSTGGGTGDCQDRWTCVVSDTDSCFCALDQQLADGTSVADSCGPVSGTCCFEAGNCFCNVDASCDGIEVASCNFSDVSAEVPSLCD
jgi:hypothetical protein